MMMKKLMLTLGLLFTALSVAFSADEKQKVWYDTADMPVYGKVRPETSEHYTRLPEKMHGVVRDKVWNLGLNSAGLYLRFRTDSRSISARWTNPSSREHPKLTAIVQRGLDLYGKREGRWWYFGVGIPKVGSTTSEYLICKHLNGEMREYMLYLPLYGGISKLELGLDEGARFEASDDPHPAYDKPIIMYGTSILHGASASRAGLCFTNVLSRRLDRQVINLGFSGNALLDYEVAEWMAECPDPAVFVLDNIPNGNAKITLEREEAFFRILRDKHPHVPVVFVENALYPTYWTESGCHKSLTAKNAAMRQVFDGLVAKGEKNIYYVPADRLLGDDGEATIDGTHYTDVGMQRYADVLEPVLRSLL